MDFIKILDYVKRTNPEMTMEKLVGKLGICSYDWLAIGIVNRGVKKTL